MRTRRLERELDWGGASLRLRLTPAAARALAARDRPLLVELELYFSCLIRKRVRFPASAGPAVLRARLAPSLEVAFRPVTGRHCRLDEAPGPPALEAFPLARVAAFRPRWLWLDCRRGRWRGEFGLAGDGGP